MIRLIVFFLFVNTAYAHKPNVGNVSATLGPFVYQSHGQSVKSNVYAQPRAGFGILGEGDLNSSGGLEIGLFYVDKIFSRAADATYIVEKINKVEIPIGYRYWISNRVSAAISFSSSFSVGDYSVIFDNTAAGSGTTSARDIVEYGFDGSLQWEFYHSGPNYWIADGRYFYSFQSKPNEDANQFGLLIGYKYMIQERQ